MAELGMRTADDLYRVSKEDFAAHHGSGILGSFNNDRLKLLQYTHPECDWQPWRFAAVPKGTWQELTNIRGFLDDFAAAKKITTAAGWQRITPMDLKAAGGGGLIYNKEWNGSVRDLVCAAYP
ncbi:hypothetical protein WJX72_006682 [[Myrmecia] bisecta]|uniref:Uncharacterized protein n=1 Tax=[Myrmecia] bisecta TaxID=41462 RepID=A0AAW1P9Q9_9CHLO